VFRREIGRRFRHEIQHGIEARKIDRRQIHRVAATIECQHGGTVECRCDVGTLSNVTGRNPAPPAIGRLPSRIIKPPPAAESNWSSLASTMVDPFVAAVVGGGVQAVPEPSTLVLLSLAALLGLIGARRR